MRNQMKASVRPWKGMWFIAAPGFDCVGIMRGTFRQACDAASYLTWKWCRRA